MSIASVRIFARVVIVLCTFAQAPGSMVIVKSVVGVIDVYVPVGRLLLIAKRARSLALLYAAIVSASSPPICKIAFAGVVLVTPFRFPGFPVVPTACVRIPNRVVIAETTFWQEFTYPPPPVLVACAMLSVVTAVVTIANKVSMVDLIAAQPPGSTVIVVSNVWVNP